MLKKSMFLLIVVLLVISTACSQQNKLENKPLVIATIFPDDFENSIFLRDYEHEFEVRSIFSDIDEVDKHWPDLDDVINTYIQENQDVDIVYGFPTYYLKGIVERGNIKKLNGLIQEDILNKIAPAVLAPIKASGEGDVYSIAPVFQNNVLVYNKEIFEELNIAAPKDSMSWDEVKNLANQINNNSHYKGLALGFASTNQDYFFLSQGLADPLDKVEDNNGKAIVDNKINRKYWKLFRDVYLENQKATAEGFIKGEVAMSIFTLDQLIDTEFLEYYSTSIEKSNWGLVEMPIFEENRGGIAYTHSLFIISSNSTNKEAVKWLEYIHGKEFAKTLEAASMFPSYWDEDIKKIFKEKYGYDFSPAFMQPGALFGVPPYEGSRVREIQNIGAEYYDKYLNGTDDIESILAKYEEAIN